MLKKQTTNNASPTDARRLRFTFLFVGLGLVLLLVALILPAWHSQKDHQSDLPTPDLEVVAQALLSYYQQNGRFPQDFRALEGRLWQGDQQYKLSTDGKGFAATGAHYYYTLHVTNPPLSGNKPQPPKAGLWACPTGSRAREAATYFWYIAPSGIERWMGPALTAENVGVVASLPSEQQLALLVMTRQAAGTGSGKNAAKGNSLFGF